MKCSTAAQNNVYFPPIFFMGMLPFNQHLVKTQERIVWDGGDNLGRGEANSEGLPAGPAASRAGPADRDTGPGRWGPSSAGTQNCALWKKQGMARWWRMLLQAWEQPGQTHAESPRRWTYTRRADGWTWSPFPAAPRNEVRNAIGSWVG